MPATVTCDNRGPTFFAMGCMNNCFPISRDRIATLRTMLPKRSYANCYLLLLHLLIEARHEDGIVHGNMVRRGQVSRSRETLCRETGLSDKAIRVAIRNLVILKEIFVGRANERANENNVLTCVNYDIWCDSIEPEGQRKAQQRANKGPTKGQEQEGEEGEEGKEVLQKLSASADGSAPAEPPAGPPKVRKARVPKLPTEPTDPRVSSRPFLKRLEAGGMVVSWARDGKLVGEILRARLASGVEDPQQELEALWDRFLELDSDPVSEVFTMRGRSHDVPAFRQHLNLLLEQARGNQDNGRARKNTTLDKVMRWAEKEEREEAERDPNGIR